MIDGAMYSGRIGGANTGERIQSAYRWDQLHILSFFKSKAWQCFFQHIDIC